MEVIAEYLTRDEAEHLETYFIKQGAKKGYHYLMTSCHEDRIALTI